MQCTLLRSLFAILLTAAFVVSQRGQDSVARVESIRVVGEADGMPRPGVGISLRGEAAVEIDAGGYLIAEDERVRRLRQSRMVRTNPKGSAKITAPMPLQPRDLVVAEPHVAVGQPNKVGDEWLIKVRDLVAVGVRVFDAEGKVMVGFPVALHAASKDISVAVTDKTGRALLGVSDEFKARAFICPAGWIGPRDGFPSVAESLSGRSGARLTLPPYGSLRFRRLRGGVSQPGLVRAQQFQHPTAYTHLSPAVRAVAKKANGVIYPYVALGLELRSYPPFGSRDSMNIVGPTKAGEMRDVDVDLGATITMRCTGFGTERIPHSLTVRLVTDAGTEKFYASHRRDGHYEVELRRAIKGKRLLRVDVDGPKHTVAHVCDHALQAAAIGLGEIELLACEPQLTGRVLDADGKPVAQVRVAISGEDKPNSGYVKMTDADGRFTSSSPVLRDAKGEPIELFAKARHGKLASDRVRGVEGAVTLTLKPLPPPRHKPVATKGSVVVRLTSTANKRDLTPLLKLDGRYGVGRQPKQKTLPDGSTEFTWAGLRGGTYRLLASAPDHGRIILFENLVVPGDGPCTDPRLDGVDHLQHMRKAVVQVVDEQSVPIAGARIMLPDQVRTTDGTGKATLYLGRDVKTVGTIQMLGKRTLRRDTWPKEFVVTLEQASSLTIHVAGLPADVPHADLEVWLRDEVRERFEGPRDMLPANHTVTVPMPPRGNYYLYLLVTKRVRNGSRSSTVHIGSEMVEIGANKDRRLEFQLDDKVVARLRQMLK